MYYWMKGIYCFYGEFRSLESFLLVCDSASTEITKFYVPPKVLELSRIQEHFSTMFGMKRIMLYRFTTTDE